MPGRRCMAVLAATALACSSPGAASGPSPVAGPRGVPPATAPRVSPGGPVSPRGSDCPKAYPLKGYPGQLGEPLYRGPFDPGYRAIRPVACFANEDDARAAGYLRDEP